MVSNTVVAMPLFCMCCAGHWQLGHDSQVTGHRFIGHHGHDTVITVMTRSSLWSLWSCLVWKAGLSSLEISCQTSCGHQCRGGIARIDYFMTARTPMALEWTANIGDGSYRVDWKKKVWVNHFGSDSSDWAVGFYGSATGFIKIK